MRIVVIGATGHIGSWLVPRLVDEGHDVVAVSRGSRQPYRSSPAWEAVHDVVIDRDTEEAAGTFGKRIAALDGEVVVDLICFEVESARHLVAALDGKVQHFLHCGTLWVHGIPRTRPYDESAPREPFGDYGIKKAAIETFLLEAAVSGFPVSILHPGHITGPGWMPINPAGHLTPRVFEQLANGETVVLPDDGEATLQHVHADDVAQTFDLVIAHRDRALGESFHVAAREPVTLRNYATEAASWFGRNANLEFLPRDEWAKTVSEYEASLTLDHIIHSPFASIEKARTRLGFEPRYTAVAAAHEAVTWMIDAGRIRI
jgi:nucleoside-diphosphate-sugar epimerase